MMEDNRSDSFVWWIISFVYASGAVCGVLALAATLGISATTLRPFALLIIPLTYISRLGWEEHYIGEVYDGNK